MLTYLINFIAALGAIFIGGGLVVGALLMWVFYHIKHYNGDDQ